MAVEMLSQRYGITIPTACRVQGMHSAGTAIPQHSAHVVPETEQEQGSSRGVKTVDISKAAG
jgi:hypothetical protein